MPRNVESRRDHHSRPAQWRAEMVKEDILIRWGITRGTAPVLKGGLISVFDSRCKVSHGKHYRTRRANAQSQGTRRWDLLWDWPRHSGMGYLLSRGSSQAPEWAVKQSESTNDGKYHGTFLNVSRAFYTRYIGRLGTLFKTLLLLGINSHPTWLEMQFLTTAKIKCD